MDPWEYSKVDLGAIRRNTTDVDLLNDLGNEGWELVNILPNGIAYMKRHLASSERPNSIKRTKPVPAKAESA